ncbi:hypothetical protein Hanom_Chr06g00532201 [Helianthus anomalus]
MICKIKGPNYIVPENDAWRHENSNSEDETDSLSGMHERRLRYWFVKDGKRKRTPKVSPRVSQQRKILHQDLLRLVDETMIPLADVIQGGVDLLKETLEDFLKENDEAEAAKAAKVQGSSVEKPEIDTSKIGVGKIRLKVKPQKKKKDSNKEDSTYIPTPEEKKKLRKKHKVVQSGVIPRNVRARKRSATVPEMQSGKALEVQVQSTPEVQAESIPKFEVQSVSIPEVQTAEVEKEKVFESPIFEKIKDLSKKVSSLEKAKAKVEAERDDLKNKLEKSLEMNEEMKLVVNDHAERIDALIEDLADNAKLIDQLTTEFSEVNAKYENMNETNKTLHQMLNDLHEASSNENKVLKLEIESLRADKAVKDEQQNMLYTMMENQLGINVQAEHNDLEIQRVAEGRAQREKELAEAKLKRRKS